MVCISVVLKNLLFDECPQLAGYGGQFVFPLESGINEVAIDGDMVCLWGMLCGAPQLADAVERVGRLHLESAYLGKSCDIVNVVALDIYINIGRKSGILPF